jgi:predicted  nucleic acid-binding Zn-ribbon protein
MTQVPVKLTDQEWQLASEELAKLELRKKSTENMLDEEADEWKERKKDLKKSIAALDGQVQKLALEVETRQRMIDAQQELPMEPEETPEEAPESNVVEMPKKGAKKKGSRAAQQEPSEDPKDESEPDEREPGAEG